MSLERHIDADHIHRVVAEQNLITNDMAEKNTFGWSEYKDAALVYPTDGIGGLNTVTIGRNTTNPISTECDFLFTKGDSSSNLGQGVSYSFPIPAERFKATMMTVQFEYKTSANYADGDIKVFLLDVTNNTLVDGAGSSLMAYSGPGTATFKTQLQTSATGSQYRLILHNASTSALAYTVQFTKVKFYKATNVTGAFISDMKSYTPTGSLSTNVTYTGKYKRNGDSLDAIIRIDFSGANSQGLVTVSIPSGLSIDTNKILTSNKGIFGNVYIYDSSSDQGYHGVVKYNVTSTVQFTRGDTTAGSGLDTSVNRPITFASGDYIEAKFSVPIAGWSSNLVLSEDVGTRGILFRGKKTGSSQTLTIGVANKLALTSLNDTTASWDGDDFLVPESGWYSTTLTATLSNLTNNTGYLIISLGGTVLTSKGVQSNEASNQWSYTYSDINYFTKGQLINATIKPIGTSTTPSLLQDNAYLTIYKLQSSQQIAASEKVYAKYTVTGLAVTNGAIVKYGTKVEDSHGAYNTTTGYYTVPRSGTICVHAGARQNGSTTFATSETYGLAIQRATTVEAFQSVQGNGVASSLISVNTGSCFKAVQGEQIAVYYYGKDNTLTTSSGNFVTFTME